MAYEKKNGDIAVFKNTKKTGESHPDYTIVGLGLNGEKIKGALWLKTDRNGNKFMAGKIEPDTYEKPGEAQAFRGERASEFSGRAGNSQARETYDLNDDIPF